MVEWAMKATLTGSTVAVVLLMTRLFGRHAGGLTAGMPVITAPALAWVAVEHGDDFAAQAAAGCVAVCSALALFAPCYARIARRAGPAASALLALLCAAALIGLLVAVLHGPERGLATQLALVALSCLGACRLMPVGTSTAPRAHALRCELLLAALGAAAVSVVVALTAPWLGPFGASVVISLPIVTTTAAIHQHVTAGAAGVTRLMHGNLAGTVGRALFCTAFALSIDPLNVAEALVLSCAAGVIGAAIATIVLPHVQAPRCHPER